MRSVSSSDAQFEEVPVEDRLIAGMRLVLASSALLIIWFDPVEPDRLVPVTYAALVSYTLYSAIVCVLVWRSAQFARRIRDWSYWADVASYTVLVTLSSGTNSIFFFGFFFAIVISSFRRGYKAGLQVTIVSVLLFTIVSLVTVSLTREWELNRFLLRPIDLAIIGYMLSYWGGSQVTLSRRLKLLKDVSRLSNPRFGLDRTIGSILEQLRAFYDADACVFVAIESGTNKYLLRRADNRDRNAAARAEVIDAKLASSLLGKDAELTFVYNTGRHPWWRFWRVNPAAPEANRDVSAEEHRAIERIANLLDAGSLVSVPMRNQNNTVGRIYLAARRHWAFDRADESFLMQVSEQVVPLLENIRLADRLAMEAADRERQRIARDIHDSIIQPYIGLQMGLAGMRKKLSVGETDGNSTVEQLLEVFNDAAVDTDRLIDMTADGISDLRGYVYGLREAGNEDSLMPAVRRFAAKFTQATNIVVQVRADTEFKVDDRTGTEIFQMIVEGLSNIRRHTQSARGFIGLDCSDGRLTLRIENDGTPSSVPKTFVPGSIAERAELLGGRSYVEIFGDMGTSVIVEIPIPDN